MTTIEIRQPVKVRKLEIQLARTVKSLRDIIDSKEFHTGLKKYYILEKRYEHLTGMPYNPATSHYMRVVD